MTANSPPPPPEQRKARQTSGEKAARRKAYREASERRAAEERATIESADAKADQENRSGVAEAEGEQPYFTDGDGYLVNYADSIMQDNFVVDIEAGAYGGFQIDHFSRVV